MIILSFGYRNGKFIANSSTSTSAAQSLRDSFGQEIICLFRKVFVAAKSTRFCSLLPSNECCAMFCDDDGEYYYYYHYYIAAWAALSVVTRTPLVKGDQLRDCLLTRNSRQQRLWVLLILLLLFMFCGRFIKLAFVKVIHIHCHYLHTVLRVRS